MDTLVKALAPVFAAGFAVQQFLEIPATLIDLYAGDRAQQYKKIILGIIGAIIGFSLAAAFKDLLVLQILTGKVNDPASTKTFLDVVVTGLIISAGTEGVNSILKFLKYTKEEKKTDAAAKTDGQPAAGAPAPTSDALKKMNDK